MEQNKKKTVGILLIVISAVVVIAVTAVIALVILGVMQFQANDATGTYQRTDGQTGEVETITPPVKQP
ncbi:hypothetical protein [Saccharibacillus kuerlensis]|uniref:Tumour necrosis factor receptor superfamily member 19 n=1 Tax=Saccharibacillus kuerlensis TaxID=459527 RepID=A0ABQ2L4Y4_9BACL|nr:hypothetical protein [Saccharibacillus kuerlensis]GGO03368.1 hypothetical protein GCM10010969_27560 [Saccharibacillus kuerlensis]